MVEAFRYAQVHQHGEAGRFPVARLERGRNLDWRSNFSPEVKRALSPLMKRVVDLATEKEGEESFLSRTIVKRFEQVTGRPDLSEAESPHIVFEALIDTLREATIPTEGSRFSQEHLQEALVWMLANAGSEGIGAVSNLTSRYLRIARYNFLNPRQAKTYDDINDEMFEKGHRIIDSSLDNWKEQGFDRYGEFEDALEEDQDKAKLFVMKCLGELFTRRAQQAIQHAAETIISLPDFAERTREYSQILGPLNMIRIFNDRYNFLLGMHEFVYDLAEEVGIIERVFPDDK